MRCTGPGRHVGEVAAESEGDARSDAQALVNTLADTLAEVEAETLGDILSNAQALVETLADKVAEVGGAVRR